MIKKQYCLSYNRDLNTANWVAWHLDIKDLGFVKRSNNFMVDNSLPVGWYRVKPTDYTHSGYDRGHMCPSGDRTATVEDNRATFLTTNITPQTLDINRGPWEKLESYSRSLVRNGKELYIYAGILNSHGYILTKDSHKINIPSYLWKIIVVLDEGTNDIARIDNQTRVIAVLMPNTNYIRKKNWNEFIENVSYIEELTHYNFFINIPKETRDILEKEIDKGAHYDKQKYY